MLLEHLGLEWQDIELDFQNTLLDYPYSELLERLSVVLAEKSGQDKVQIRRALGKLHLEDYQLFIQNIIPT